MIKAIIFDCFGVLVGRGFQETYRLAGGDPISDADFIREMLYKASMGQVSGQQFRQQLSQQLGISVEQWDEAAVQAERLDERLLDYCADLRGNYKTAVLSNCNRGVLEDVIGIDNLTKAFDVWVASAEVGSIKPEPEIYHYTCSQLGVEPDQAIFIDDSQRHVEAAEHLGMIGIVYDSFTDMKRQLEKHITPPADL